MPKRALTAVKCLWTHLPILVGPSVLQNGQVSWLMIIAPCAFPSEDSGIVQAAPIHSGGTAPDFHRTSLFMARARQHGFCQPIFLLTNCI